MSESKNSIGERPVFVSGRQHSGNTLVADLIAGTDGFFGLSKEAQYFDRRFRLKTLGPDELEKAMAEVVRRSGLPERLEGRMLTLIADRLKKGMGADALYRSVMAGLASSEGERRWAQKGTSLVFFTDEIVEVFPDAKILFLLRNPLDLAISWNKRYGERTNWLRFAMGWNRGVGLAATMERKHASHFKVVRYEDIVLETEDTFAAIGDFVEAETPINWQSAVHVNEADTPHIKSSKKGFSKSPIYRFRRVELPSEFPALLRRIDGPLFSQFYPELEEDFERLKKQGRVGGALSFWLKSGRCMMADLRRDWHRSPKHLVNRLKKRLLRSR